ncbi:hypothetical protein KIH39_23835 [Telmatocola sphagniphila]|uniref:Uncharacterized protein n=1 Tax=Telmatocola sphagniphila TaxID=1123043 RepID=A0A8E6B448_9BACT|nr:hypothetical protein [Telmatocola sphagniphila]QVL31830.1 hypothetical protein KIH39_23835 [Telmatocola sphagniphila]
MIDDETFTFRIMGGHDVGDVHNDNFDIEVIMANGDRYIGTTFTIANIVTIMERHEKSGESSKGAYFWASDMLIVKDLQFHTIHAAIAGLIEEELLETAFSKVPS